MQPKYLELFSIFNSYEIGHEFSREDFKKDFPSKVISPSKALLGFVLSCIEDLGAISSDRRFINGSPKRSKWYIKVDNVDLSSFKEKFRSKTERKVPEKKRTADKAIEKEVFESMENTEIVISSADFIRMKDEILNLRKSLSSCQKELRELLDENEQLKTQTKILSSRAVVKKTRPCMDWLAEDPL